MTGPSAPLVWVLMGHKQGDNAQLRALADALGWPYTVKQLRYRTTELFSNRLLGVTLLGIRRADSSALQSPWPDLVLTAGRRNEPVARWIRRQATHPVRLVHVGRPWAKVDAFDLIITTPQYYLNPGDRVLVNALPLLAPTDLGADPGERPWQALPRPWIAVLVGGNSGPYVFDRERAAALARQLNTLATQSGGSLLVTTSARTPPLAIAILAKALSPPHYLYRWRAGDDANPYRRLLHDADSLVVTAESASMVAEAVATAKPVYLFPLGEGPFAMRPDPVQDPYWWRRLWRYKVWSHWLVQTLGPLRLRRDIRRLQQRLLEEGRVAWLGEASPSPRGGASASIDLATAVARVREILSMPPCPGRTGR